MNPFRKSLINQCQRWSDKGLNCKIIPPEHPRQSTTLEFETKDKLGTLSIWENGYCDAIICHFNSEETINEHTRLQNLSDFEKMIQAFEEKHLQGELNAGH